MRFDETRSFPHRPGAGCNENTCYCIDDGVGDPMCDCGAPGWDCRCLEMSDEDDFGDVERARLP